MLKTFVLTAAAVLMAATAAAAQHGPPSPPPPPPPPPDNPPPPPSSLSANTPDGQAPAEYPVCSKRGQDRCKVVVRRGR